MEKKKGTAVDVDKKINETATEIKDAIKDAMEPMVKAQEESAKTIKTLEERLEKAEQKNIKSSVKSILVDGEEKAVKDLEEKEVADNFVKALFTNDMDTVKKLSEGVDGEGGYTVPVPVANELLEIADEYGVIAPLVQTIQMASRTLDVTELVKTGVTLTWEGEYVSATETDVSFDKIVLTAYKIRAKVVITSELIEDSNFDVVNIVKRVLGEKLAGETDQVICQGTGTGQPSGMFNDTTLIANKTTGAIDYDAIIDIKASLAPRFRKGATFLVNTQEVTALEKLKDANGLPIWRNGLVAADGAILAGYPVVESDKVPAGSIIFGNLKEGYWLGYRNGLTVETERDYDKDAQNIFIRRRLAGRVVRANVLHLHTLV